MREVPSSPISPRNRSLGLCCSAKSFRPFSPFVLFQSYQISSVGHKRYICTSSSSETRYHGHFEAREKLLNAKLFKHDLTADRLPLPFSTEPRPGFSRGIEDIFQLERIGDIWAAFYAENFMKIPTSSVCSAVYSFSETLDYGYNGRRFYADMGLAALSYGPLTPNLHFTLYNLDHLISPLDLVPIQTQTYEDFSRPTFGEHERNVQDPRIYKIISPMLEFAYSWFYCNSSYPNTPEKCSPHSLTILDYKLSWESSGNIFPPNSDTNSSLLSSDPLYRPKFGAALIYWFELHTIDLVCMSDKKQIVFSFRPRFSNIEDHQPRPRLSKRTL